MAAETEDDRDLLTVFMRQRDKRLNEIRNKTHTDHREKIEAEALKHIPFVIRIARKHKEQGRQAQLTLMDLLQEGYFGLLKAIEKFDVGRGVIFITYAQWWIRATISRAIVNSPGRRGIRVTASRAEKIRNLDLSIRRMTDILGRPPTEDEVINEWVNNHNLTRKQVSELLAVREMHTLRLHTGSSADPDDDGQHLENLLQSPEPNPEEATLTVNSQLLVLEALNGMDERLRELLVRRYGLFGYEPHSLQEIANIMNLSRERIRQIQDKALAELRLELGQRFESRAAK